jgi:hypothetical protein
MEECRDTLLIHRCPKVKTEKSVYQEDRSGPPPSVNRSGAPAASPGRTTRMTWHETHTRTRIIREVEAEELALTGASRVAPSRKIRRFRGGPVFS